MLTNDRYIRRCCTVKVQICATESIRSYNTILASSSTFNINVIFGTSCSYFSCGGAIAKIVSIWIIITRGVFCAAKSSFLTDACVVAVMITIER